MSENESSIPAAVRLPDESIFGWTMRRVFAFMEDPVAPFSRAFRNPHRLLQVFLQLLILTSLVLIPLLYYPAAKRNFEFPKTMAARFLLILALLTWLAASRQKVLRSLRERTGPLLFLGVATVLALLASFFAPAAHGVPLTLLGVFPAAALLFALIAGGSTPSLRSPLKLPALVYFTGVVVSCFAATNMTECLDVKGVIEHFLYLFLMLAAYQMMTNTKILRLSILLMMLTGCMVALLAVCQYFRVDVTLDKINPFEGIRLGLSAQGDNWPVSTLGNRNYAAQYIEVLFPIALLMILGAGSRWGKVLYGAAALLMYAHLEVADTTGADIGILLGFLVIALVVIFRRPEKRKEFLFLTGGWLSIAGMLSFYQFYWDRLHKLYFLRDLMDRLRPLVRDGNRELFSKVVDDWWMSFPSGYRVSFDNFQGADDKLGNAIKRIEPMFADGAWIGQIPVTFWGGLALIAFTAVLYYGIPAVLRKSGAEKEIGRVKRIFATVAVLGAFLFVLVKVPSKISSGVEAKRKAIDARIAAGKPTEKHWYLRGETEEPTDPDGDYFQPALPKEKELSQFQSGEEYDVLDYVFDKALSRTFVFRCECWRGASRNFVFNLKEWGGLPLFGIGVQNFKVTHPMRQFESQLERTILGIEVLARKVHNDWIAIGLENGILAVLGILWIIVIVFKSISVGLGRWRRMVRLGVPEGECSYIFFLLMALLMGYITTLFHAGVSSNLLQPASTAMFWFVTGMIPGIVRSLGRYRKAPIESPDEEVAVSPANPDALDSPFHGRFRWTGWRSIQCLVFSVVFLIFFGWVMHHWISELYMREGMATKDYTDNLADCRGYIDQLSGGIVQRSRIRSTMEDPRNADYMERLESMDRQATQDCRIGLLYAVSMLRNLRERHFAESDSFSDIRDEGTALAARAEDRLRSIAETVLAEEASVEDLESAKERASAARRDVNELIGVVFDQVYVHFDKSIRFYPHYMETYYIVGRYYIDGASHDSDQLRKDPTEKLRAGARVLRQDLYMNPNYKWAHNNLGVIYDKLAQAAVAEKVNYEQKAKRLRTEAEALREAGDESAAQEAEVKAQRFDDLAADPALAQKADDYHLKARNSYANAIEIDPDQIFALYNLGSGYHRTAMKIAQDEGVEAAEKDLAKAEEYFRGAIRQEPDKWSCYDMLADIHLIQNEVEKAIPYAEWTVFSDPSKRKFAEVYDERAAEFADAYVRPEAPIDANPGARKTLRDPRTRAVPKYLSDEERLHRAVEIYRQVMEETPKNEIRWRQLAYKISIVLGMLEDYSAAIEEIEGAFGEIPENAYAWADLAAYYALTGDREHALEVVNGLIGGMVSLKMDPDNLLDRMVESADERKEVIQEIQGEIEKAGPVTDGTE